MAAPDAKEKEHVQDGRKMTMSSPDVRIVRLNIGGYKYATTRATLLSVPSSYFEALLEERVPTPKDEKGAYFIDRDGQYFPPILTYLRTKELHVPMSDRRAVLREAKFYLLAPVVQLLQGVITQDEEIQASRWHAHAQKVPPAAYVDPTRCAYSDASTLSSTSRRSISAFKNSSRRAALRRRSRSQRSTRTVLPPHPPTPISSSSPFAAHLRRPSKR